MKTTAITTACVLVILLAPMPSEAKWLALVPIGFALFMAVLSERAERRAERAHQADLERRLTAIPSTEWEQYVADVLHLTERAAVTPLPGVRLRSVPTQRDGSVS